MSFSARTWAATAGIRAAIDELAFVRELGDGSLQRQRFTYYMAQDALYLGDYARVLAGLAVMAPEAEQSLFWARSAHETVVVERSLHTAHVDDFSAARMSPTCRGYTAYLLSLLVGGSYPVAVAGVLPCFWIYQDVGERLLAVAGDLHAHPYGDWIGAYADDAFAQSVRQARAIADELAASADPATVTRMHEAFATASRYEWMFWDAAHREEAWPV